jgi:hypothetical protein
VSKTSRTLTVLSAVAIGTIGFGASPAGADPRTDSVAFTCDRLGSVEAEVFSNGMSSPVLVADNNTLLIPYKLHIQGTFRRGGWPPQTFSDGFIKPGPRREHIDRCTFHKESSSSFGTVVVDGEVWISH